MLRSEVLPAPFGPMTEISSPGATVSVTASTARTPPKCFDTAEIASWASRDGTLPPFTSPDTIPPAFPSPSTARICAPLMAGMMQTQMTEGNGLCHCRALLLLPGFLRSVLNEPLGSEPAWRRVVAESGGGEWLR